jgi:hypothetical protein
MAEAVKAANAMAAAAIRDVAMAAAAMAAAAMAAAIRDIAIRDVAVERGIPLATARSFGGRVEGPLNRWLSGLRLRGDAAAPRDSRRRLDHPPPRRVNVHRRKK